jgi:hypothetical protein
LRGSYKIYYSLIKYNRKVSFFMVDRGKDDDDKSSVRRRWRLVVKRGVRSPEVGGMIRWEVVAYPPGGRGSRLVSYFESGRKCGRYDFAARLVGKVEDLLEVVAPGWRPPGGVLDPAELEGAGKR